MRPLMLLSLAGTIIVIGCAGCSHSPTAPRAAHVQFDSLTVVSEGGLTWWAFALSNRGNATAFNVRAYWHFTGQDSARSSQSQPSNLLPGQSGWAATAMTSNVAWMNPSAPDSIRWADQP